MPLFDFRCAAGHVTERFASADLTSVVCACGERARRQIPRIAVGHPDSRVNGGFKRYDEATAEMEDSFARREQQEGVELARPNLVRAAKKKAARAAKAGATTI